MNGVVIFRMVAVIDINVVNVVTCPLFTVALC